jgi:hypothetical protein
MNIFNYIKSSDIAAHCEKINHVFNPVEMAVIIDTSGKTIKEKHAAWRELISEYPDMPVHGSCNFDEQESLHTYLQELMTWQEKAIEKFCASGENIVFRPVCDDDEGGISRTYERANTELLNKWDWEEDKVEWASIRKEIIDGDGNCCGEARVDSSGEILSFWIDSDGEEEKPDTFDMIYIDLPVPFEAGDIVTIKNNEPVVIQWLPHTGENYKDFVSGKNGDGSDMAVSVYHIGDYISKGSHLYIDQHPHSVWDIKYFRGELKGLHRFLKYLSQFIKRKDTDLAWLITVFQKFKAEADSEDYNELFGGWYIPLEDENL